MQFLSASDLLIASLHRPLLYPGGKVAILQPTTFSRLAPEEFQMVYTVYPFALFYFLM
jgi:hypothetical protein